MDMLITKGHLIFCCTLCFTVTLVGEGVQEYNSPNLLSRQANVRKRFWSFPRYATGMLGDAPEMCWGLGGQLCVITALPPTRIIHKRKSEVDF